MSRPLQLASKVLEDTFQHFRQCGCGRKECQVLWIGPWTQPHLISEAVHPKHVAHFDGFILDDVWLTEFFTNLGDANAGIRVQVHTHPSEAFHSRVDDQFPIVHTPGFLSLVVPDFGLGSVNFDKAFLAEIQADGTWNEVPIASRLVIT